MGGSMSSVIITGDTSGAITLAAPTVAGTNTLTLPANTGTVLTSGAAVTVAQGGTARTTAPAYCHVYLSADTGSIINGATKAPMNSVTIDNASGYNTSTYVYTVPTGYAGYYQVTVKARLRNYTNNSTNNANQYFGYLYKNGSALWTHEIDVITSLFYWTYSYTITGIVQLAVGDTLSHYANNAGTANSFGFRATDTSMTIIQLYGA